MNERKYELRMLEEMETYQLRLSLIADDRAYWEYQLVRIDNELQSSYAEEKHYIAMGKRYLEYYNEENREEDWQAAEEYIALATNIREYRVYLRSTLPEVSDMVRRYKKEWAQQNKMAQLQQQLTKKQHKN